VKICSEYFEKINIYADGELPEHERPSVEKHLGECESCSALLSFLREISAAASDSILPAPESLCGGVMEKILRGDNISDISSAFKSVPYEKPGKYRTARFMLTRYAPIAACLAVVLLALPFIRNMSRNSYDSYSMTGLAPASMPEAASKSANNAPGSPAMEAYDAVIPGEAGGSAETEADSGGGSLLVPSSDPSSASAPGASNSGAPDAGAPGSSTSGSSTPDSGASSSSAPGSNSPSSSIPDDRIETPAPPSFTIAGNDIYVDEPDEWVEDEPDGDAVWTGSDNGSLPADEILKGFFSEVPGYFSEAYAWIAICGELPDALLEFDPAPVDSWGVWDAWYAIPSGDAQLLIDVMDGMGGFSYEYKDDSCDTAYVFYIHK